MSWRDSPIVSFARGGERFELGRGPDDPVLHLYGSEGLGLAPVEVASTERITGDGSIVQNVRYGNREVFIPLMLEAGSLRGLSAMRRELYQLLAPDLGEVEVRVQDPATGTDRMVRGLYKSGLEGDFGDGYYGSWQTLGLTFECHDPWWHGDLRVREWSLSTVVKPYWTSFPRLPHYPAWLTSSTVTGQFEFDVSGDKDAYPVWTIYPPGADVLIECGNGCGKRLFLEGEITEPITFDTANEDITSPTLDRGELWDRVSMDSDFFTLPPGPNKVRVAMVGAEAASKVVLEYRERFRAGY